MTANSCFLSSSKASDGLSTDWMLNARLKLNRPGECVEVVLLVINDQDWVIFGVKSHGKMPMQGTAKPASRGRPGLKNPAREALKWQKTARYAGAAC